MTEDKLKIADKIRKILAKATNNPSQGETETALLKAQELLIKHGLTMSDLQVVGGSSREIVKDGAHDWTKSPWWYYPLAKVLGDNFRCYVYVEEGRKYSNGVTSKTHKADRVVFMGLKDDVETCKTCFNYAMMYVQYQTQRVRRKVRKEGRDTGGVANDYIVGFINGLKDKFTEQVAANCWAVALVKDPELTEKFNQISLTNSQTKFKRRRDEEAYNMGYQQGKTFDKPSGFIKGGGE